MPLRRIGMAAAITLTMAAGSVAIAISTEPEETLRVWAQPTTTFEQSSIPPRPNFSLGSSWWFRPIEKRGSRKEADVFFVHGTSYFGNRRWNDTIDAESGDWRLTRIALPAMTAPFRDCCRVFAPRYRQANLAAFLTTGEDAEAALELAYSDVRAAFSWYLDNSDRRRPLILAGLSQGSLHLQRLVQEFASDRRLHGRLVVAYLVGYPALDPGNDAISVCRSATEINCFVAWNTLGEGGAAARWRDRVVVWTDTGYARNEGREFVCVNPLSWSSDDATAFPQSHKGGRLVPLRETTHAHLVSARCRNGILFISRPTNPAYSILVLPGRDYHVMEYNLFHEDIRLNVLDRIDAFRKTSQTRAD